EFSGVLFQFNNTRSTQRSLGQVELPAPDARGKRPPVIRGEDQRRPVRVLRVTHRDDSRQVGSDLYAVAARPVGKSALAPDGLRQVGCHVHGVSLLEGYGSSSCPAMPAIKAREASMPAAVARKWSTTSL